MENIICKMLRNAKILFLEFFIAARQHREWSEKAACLSYSPPLYCVVVCSIAAWNASKKKGEITPRRVRFKCSQKMTLIQPGLVGAERSGHCCCEKCCHCRHCLPRAKVVTENEWKLADRENANVEFEKWNILFMKEKQSEKNINE